MGGSGSAWASSARFPVSAPTGCAGAGKASIHRSAWKGNSPKFILRILHSSGANGPGSPYCPPMLDRPLLHIVVLNGYAVG